MKEFERYISEIGNHEGDLWIEKRVGKYAGYYWGLENHAGIRVSPIPKSLFDELMAYQDEVDANGIDEAKQINYSETRRTIYFNGEEETNVDYPHLPDYKP